MVWVKITLDARYEFQHLLTIWLWIIVERYCTVQLGTLVVGMKKTFAVLTVSFSNYEMANTTQPCPLFSRTNMEETFTLKNAYVIVDNGYLTWSTTVPPLKNSMNRCEITFSKWLESLRKYVECTFGILKGWCGVLETGIRTQNTEVAYNILLTCCAIHNRDWEIPTAPFHFRYWKRPVDKPVSRHVVGRLHGIWKPPL